MSIREVAGVLVYGVFSLSVAQLVSQVFNLLTAIFLARSLGPGDYGLWSLAWSSIGFFAIALSVLGIGDAIVKFVSQYAAERRLGLMRKITIVGFKIQVLASFICSALAFVLAPFIAQNIMHLSQLTVLIQILAVNMMVVNLGIVSATLEGLKKFHVSALLGVLYNALKFFFLIVVLWLGFGLMGVAIGHLVTNLILTTVILMVVFIKYLPKSSNFVKENEKKLLKTLIFYGTPVALSGLISDLYVNFTVFYLGIWSAPLDVGFFTTASSMSSFVRNIPLGVVMGVLFPIVSEMHIKKQIEEIRKLVSLILKHTLFFMSYITAFTLVFAPEIMIFLYSQKFEPSAFYLQILIFLTVLAVPQNLASTLMLGTGQTSLKFKIVAVSNIIGTIITLAVVPLFGAIGLCFTALLISSLISLPLYTVYSKKLIGNFFTPKAYLTSIPSILFCFALLFISRQFFFQNLAIGRHEFLLLIPLVCIFFLGLIVFYISICLVGGVRKREIVSIREILSSSPTKIILTPLIKILERFAR